MGTVAGGGDDDHLNMAGLDAMLTIALSDTPTADGFSGDVSGDATIAFTGIDEVTGGSVADTLMGRDAATTWAVTADGVGTLTDTGTMEELAFNSIANLTGGNMMDTFTVSGAHTGDLTGGDGVNTYTIEAMLTGDVTGGDGVDTLNLNTNGVVDGRCQYGWW